MIYINVNDGFKLNNLCIDMNRNCHIAKNNKVALGTFHVRNTTNENKILQFSISPDITENHQSLLTIRLLLLVIRSLLTIETNVLNKSSEFKLLKNSTK